MSKKPKRSRSKSRRKEAWVPLVPINKEKFGNDLYVVEFVPLGSKEGMGEHILLKVRSRRSSKPPTYSDLMKIKDELIGEQAEAVQVYPSRDREKRDVQETCLWCFTDYVWPIGYPENVKTN